MACASDPEIPQAFQEWYDSMSLFLASDLFAAPETYKRTAYGVQLITASAGIEFWGVENSNDIASDAPLHYDLNVHKLMIDLIKETGADFIQIRTRYPDNAYAAGAEEALKGAIRYAKSKGLGIYLMFIPEGPEHLHVNYGDTAAFVQKFEDFVNEYVVTLKPQFFQMYGSEQISRSMGVDADALIPDFYTAIKAASPHTQYVEAEGANAESQVIRFKYFCDSPYNDVMGIPLHDLYNPTYAQNVQDMITYAKSKNRTLISPDCWLTDAHFGSLDEMFLNTGWREPLDAQYMTGVVNLAQSLGFRAISIFYGNFFVAYDPGFFYPVSDMPSDAWVSCLEQGIITSVGPEYKLAIASTKAAASGESGSIVPLLVVGIGAMALLLSMKKGR